MGLWFDVDIESRYNRIISIDLSTLRPLVAGPRRPQDRRSASDLKEGIELALKRKLKNPPATPAEVPDGAIGIAAITSCTNTSDPRLLIAAGLLARKARARGLTPPPWVKTSLAPGSPSAKAYLERAGLLDDLEAVGFGIVGFGCTTCIGNSGALPEAIETALRDGKAVTAILSGNRNFPGRVHPKLSLGYLASPPLVVALALKGHVHGDNLHDPIGVDQVGNPVHLADLWPDETEIESAHAIAFRANDVPVAFRQASANQAWQAISASEARQFPWNPKSRYLRKPIFASQGQPCRRGSYKAKPLLVLGDDITTDHISPAGWIDPESAAGCWLTERGGDPKNLNVYAAYRGNWEVMLHGLFTNRLLKNHLADDLPPAHTILEDGAVLSLPDAAEHLRRQQQPAVIIAGERYGMGSSRDWAAKGTALLHVRAVIARSFERIHRTNLIGMGILPIEIVDDFIPARAGITPGDQFEIDLEADVLQPRLAFAVTWHRASGQQKTLSARAAVETGQEVETLLSGGVLPAVLKRVV